jgi:predicted esterase
MLGLILLAVSFNGVLKAEPVNPEQIDIYSFDPLQQGTESVSGYPARAYEFYEQGNFQQAARYYLAYLASYPDDYESWYNLACCYGLLGSAKEAAHYLKIAYKKGYTDLDSISKDKDFDTVRGAKTFTLALDSLQIWQEKINDAKGEMRYFGIRQYIPYYIHLPKDYSADKQYTLLIGMHGFGGAANNFGYLWTQLKDENVIYVVPEAPYAFPENEKAMFSWTPFVERESKTSLTAFGWVNEYIPGLVKTLEKQYRIKQTWLLGFSQGAYLGYLLTINNPKVFDGLVACGGGLYTDVLNSKDYKKAKNLRVIISHGSQDNVVPYSESETAYNFLQQKGLKVQLDTFEGGHKVSKSALTAFLDIIR